MQGFFQDVGQEGGKMAICNLVGGMALSTCTALDNVAESFIQSIALTIHKA